MFVLVSALSVVDDPLFRYTIRLDPIPALRDAATAVGSPSVSIDADGTVRRARLRTPDMPSFAFQVVRRYLQHPTSVTAATAESKRFNEKDLLREMLINYLGPSKTVKTVSYYQALDYERMLPPEFFAGRIVLVGRLLEAIPNRNVCRATPSSPPSPGLPRTPPRASRFRPPSSAIFWRDALSPNSASEGS